MAEIPSEPPTSPGSTSKRAGKLIFRLLFLVALPVALLGAGYLALKDVYELYAETDPPVIEILNQPTGIGEGPVRFSLALSETGAGLDEVVVRLKHKGHSREILRKSLDGGKSEEVSVKFSGRDMGLEEGNVSIEVRAFDRSFFSNAAEAEFKLKVDYRKPRLEVVTSQHNTRRGGSQLIFYRAFDQDLAYSGVQIGDNRYFGVPASRLDKELQDPELYAAVFAYDLRNEGKDLPLRLFAEDEVGNTTYASFYYTLLKRARRKVRVRVEEDYLRHVADIAEKVRSDRGDGGLGTLLREFKFVSKELRASDEELILGKLRGASKLENPVLAPFEEQPGVVRTTFGDELVYTFEDQELDRAMEKGIELIPNERSVLSQQAGVVLFTADLPFYGKCVAVDHGMGISTFFARLGEVSVREGAEVKKGDVLGAVGGSGFGRKPHLYLEFRVNGVPVDPREWWDRSWFNAHILGKLKEVKRSIGTFNIPEE